MIDYDLILDNNCIGFTFVLVNRTVFNVVDQSFSLNCEQIQEDVGCNKDGVYTVCPRGTALSVYCDLTSDGGGWTVRKHVYIVLCVFTFVFLSLCLFI